MSLGGEPGRGLGPQRWPEGVSEARERAHQAGDTAMQRSCGESMPGMLEGSGSGRDLSALGLVSAAGLRPSLPEAAEGWRHHSHSCPIALPL